MSQGWIDTPKPEPTAEERAWLGEVSAEVSAYYQGDTHAVQHSTEKAIETVQVEPQAPKVMKKRGRPAKLKSVEEMEL